MASRLGSSPTSRQFLPTLAHLVVLCCTNHQSRIETNKVQIFSLSACRLLQEPAPVSSVYPADSKSLLDCVDRKAALSNAISFLFQPCWSGLNPTTATTPSFVAIGHHSQCFRASHPMGCREPGGERSQSGQVLFLLVNRVIQNERSRRRSNVVNLAAVEAITNYEELEDGT
ncbi:hypothetical protein F5141DRAFT_389750 [Pisolithus sp. B1]|nr:hypothetical protein F5141DRAFT_389750 [Pisolithus sp. B1]